MNDDFEVPLSLFPLVSISTLSTLISRKDATAYQIALLVCMLLAHSLASTDVSKLTGENHLLCNVTIAISYVPPFLSIMDTFLSQTAFFSDFSPRIRAAPAPAPAGGRGCKFMDHVKLWFRSLIPTSLILTYASLVMIKISISSFQERMKIQAAIFGFSWLFFVELYYWRRKKFLGVAAATGSAGTSTIMAIGTSTHLTDHDERNWERWNTHEFLDWTKHKYIQFNNEVDEDDLANFLMMIQSQRINGASLPYLGIREFRSMGISHGNAVMLFHSLSVLMQQYSSSSRTTKSYRFSDSHAHAHAGAGESQSQSQNYHEGIDLDAWLGKKIGQPPPRNDDSDDEENNDIQPPPPPPPEAFAFSNISATKKEQSDFQESNNLGLSNYPNNLRGDDHRATNVDSLGAAPPQAAQSNGFGSGMASTSTSTESQFDESLLSAMPPSVRDIAARRPDIVQALLAKKQQSIPEVKAGLFPIDEEAGDGDGGSGSREELDLEENVDTDWNSGQFNTTEMMGLLRRRGKKD